MTSFRVICQDGDGNHTTPDQWVGRRIRGEDRARPRKRTLRKDQDAVGWVITGTPRQRPEGFADVVSLLGCCARRKKVRQHSANWAGVEDQVRSARADREHSIDHPVFKRRDLNTECVQVSGKRFTCGRNHPRPA